MRRGPELTTSCCSTRMATIKPSFTRFPHVGTRGIASRMRLRNPYPTYSTSRSDLLTDCTAHVDRGLLLARHHPENLDPGDKLKVLQLHRQPWIGYTTLWDLAELTVCTVRCVLTVHGLVYTYAGGACPAVGSRANLTPVHRMYFVHAHTSSYKREGILHDVIQLTHSTSSPTCSNHANLAAAVVAVAVAAATTAAALRGAFA
nr:hypothetical protein CFP56_32363 [Quercus suber]